MHQRIIGRHRRSRHIPALPAACVQVVTVLAAATISIMLTAVIGR